MRVYIGPYPNFYSVYQVVDLLKYVGVSEDKCFEISGKLSKVKWLESFFSVLNSRKRKIKVKIHKYDTWNFDNTLAHIALPALIQLKETKKGSGFIDLEDVPECLRFTDIEDWDNQFCFDFYYDEQFVKRNCDVHTRYDWALGEMIWAFQQLLDDDWEQQYWSVQPEIDLTVYPEDEGKETYPIRWKTRGECDWEARAKHQKRIDYGLYLFGKYYQTLWD